MILQRWCVSLYLSILNKKYIPFRRCSDDGLFHPELRRKFFPMHKICWARSTWLSVFESYMWMKMICLFSVFFWDCQKCGKRLTNVADIASKRVKICLWYPYTESESEDNLIVKPTTKQTTNLTFPLNIKYYGSSWAQKHSYQKYYWFFFYLQLELFNLEKNKKMRSCVFEVMSGRRLLFSIVIRGKFDNEMSLQRITFQMWLFSCH